MSSSGSYSNDLLAFEESSYDSLPLDQLAQHLSRLNLPRHALSIVEAVNECFVESAKRGDLGRMKTLLESGAPECPNDLNEKGTMVRADVDTTAYWNRTALHWAARADDLAMVSYLIGMGANVNVADVEGETPLHAASFRCSAAVVGALLAAGAKHQQEDGLQDVPIDKCPLELNEKEVELYSALAEAERGGVASPG